MWNRAAGSVYSLIVVFILVLGAFLLLLVFLLRRDDVADLIELILQRLVLGFKLRELFLGLTQFRAVIGDGLAGHDAAPPGTESNRRRQPFQGCAPRTGYGLG